MDLRRRAEELVSRAGESTLRAALFHGVFVAAVTVFKSATNALYLAREDPAGLPRLYVLVAAGMALTTFALAGPLAGRAPRWLLSRATWTFAATAAVLVGAHALGLRGALGALYVVAELYGTSLSILFWSTVSTWFDARSSRQAFSLLSAGGMAGALAGGLGTRVLAGLLGNALSCVVVTLGAALAVRLMGTRKGTETSPRTGARGMFAGGAYLAGHRYPKLLALLATVWSALGACVDFVFRSEASTQMSELQLAGLFGDLNAAVGAVAIAWQLGATRRILERGGVFLFIAVIPTLMVLTSAAATFLDVFGLLLFMKAMEMAGSFSIMQSGIQLLYNPVPVEYRAAVRSLIDGLIKKGGMAVAGVMLAVAVTELPVAASPWGVAVLALVYLVVLRAVRGAYVDTLAERLSGPRAMVSRDLHVEDRSTRLALLRTLSSTRGPEVLAALAILRRDPRFSAVPHLDALLTHEDEAVRVAAMDLIPHHPPPDVEFTLASILSMDARRPRAAAARVYARAVPERAAAALAPYLHDADPGVSCAVILALLRLPEAAPAARARLDEMILRIPDATPAERRELARTLGELPADTATVPLSTLVADADATVRGIAFESSARHFKAARDADDAPAEVLPLARAVLGRLAHRHDRAGACAALAALGDVFLPDLRRALDDRAVPLAIRMQVPRILRAVGTEAASTALLYSNISDHPSLRYRIADALFDLHRAHPGVRADPERAREAALRRLNAFEQYRPLCRQLLAAECTAPAGGPTRRAWDMLRRATTDRLAQNLEMSLHLMALLHGPEKLHGAAEALVRFERASLAGGAVPEPLVSARAMAIEVVDVCLEGDPLHGAFMRALEQRDGETEQVQTFADVATTARTLRASADPAIRAFAQRVLRGGVLSPEESSLPRPLPTPGGIPVAAQQVDPTDSQEVPDMDETTLNRIMALEKVDLFEGLTVDDLAALAGIAEERHAEPGEVLYREGEPGDSMMVIIAGQLTLTRAGRVVLHHKPGDSIGQVSFLDRGPRPTTAVVDPGGTGAELLCIRNESFMDLVMDRPELNRGLFVVLGRRLRALLDLPGTRERG